MTILSAILILLVGVFAGSFGAVIGSSLLVIVPALLLLGLPAPQALGTGKVSAFFRDLPALIVFHRSKKVRYDTGILFTLSGIAGTVWGTYYALSLSEETLEDLICLFTIATGLLMLVKPNLGISEGRVLPSRVWGIVLSLLLGLLAGFYAGIFGGGVNLLIIFAFVLILGHDFLTAVATSKVPNLIFIVTFTIIFAAHGQIDYVAAIPLTIGMAIGGHYGAKLALAGGNRFVRILFLSLAFVMAGKMLFWD